jgi:hypothetical protein
MQDPSMRDALLRLSSDDLAWDKTDDATVWRRLFTDTLFQQPSIAQHHWVMDGIDECEDFDLLFTNKFLTSLPVGLRLFATSRRLEVALGAHLLRIPDQHLQSCQDWLWRDCHPDRGMTVSCG